MSDYEIIKELYPMPIDNSPVVGLHSVRYNFRVSRYSERSRLSTVANCRYTPGPNWAACYCVDTHRRELENSPRDRNRTIRA